MEKKKILIVEDEVIVAMEVEMHLQINGFNIVGKVQTSEQAIECARRELPDIILMDINIRGNDDGIDAVKKILSFSSPGIIFLTAYNDSDTLNRITEIPGAKVVSKPFLVDDLLSTVNSLIEK